LETPIQHFGFFNTDRSERRVNRAMAQASSSGGISRNGNLQIRSATTQGHGKRLEQPHVHRNMASDLT